MKWGRSVSVESADQIIPAHVTETPDTICQKRDQAPTFNQRYKKKSTTLMGVSSPFFSLSSCSLLFIYSFVFFICTAIF